MMGARRRPLPRMRSESPGGGSGSKGSPPTKKTLKKKTASRKPTGEPKRKTGSKRLTKKKPR